MALALTFGPRNEKGDISPDEWLIVSVVVTRFGLVILYIKLIKYLFFSFSKTEKTFFLRTLVLCIFFHH